MTSDHSYVTAQHRTGSLFIVINWVKFLRGREGIFQIKREFVALQNTNKSLRPKDRPTDPPTDQASEFALTY